MKNSKRNIFNKFGIAIAITLFFKIVFFRMHEFFQMDLLFILAIVLLIWLGNEAINKGLNSKYSWIENAKKRLIIQSILSILFTSSALFPIMYLLHQLKFGDGQIVNHKMIEIFPPALLFTFALLAVKIGSEFFSALKNSLIETEVKISKELLLNNSNSEEQNIQIRKGKNRLKIKTDNQPRIISITNEKEKIIFIK